ncbi:hypothetical protein [Tessaracoccus flavus]|uniref:Uncharacterized protein n=1 Tax=Tessaracoccus flavus TaxID=1610493 RepID=A0A1Q2CFE7_9ACTN|nr:hypothetical protein [Tessaracoccus flavus]AQP44790.1 hypothetical protein RPIT_08250 [Tessaracoccus flavus]SDZ19511.1 hypothetical protein SAMN05428934_11525 [Tessaracoccus flavus]
MRDFHKPVHRPADVLESLRGAGDPAELSSLANDTAAALLGRVRESEDPDMVDRVIAYADRNGVDDVAELWASAPAASLPGAMWRLYLLRHAVVTNPEATGYRFRRGLEVDGGVHQAIAGSRSAPTPDQVADLATTILRGAFTGDFADALERASAFARVLAFGSSDIDDHRQANGYDGIADELRGSARLWREGQLH